MNTLHSSQTEFTFSYSSWTDAMNVESNPVENKIRRDWLSKVLVDQLDGYEPKMDSEECEYLNHYADKIFVECLNLSYKSPLSSIVSGRIQVARDAGWAVNAMAFGNIFNDAHTALAIKFSQWLKEQPSAGEVLKDQLLGIYCNAPNEDVAKTLLRQTPIEIKLS